MFDGNVMAEDALRVLLNNHSTASLQAAGIQHDLAELQEFWGNLTDTSWKRLQPAFERASRSAKHIRALMGFGITDTDYSNLGCGYATLFTASPNTYPCCKGLWCCVPPPFPDDFYVRKEWFAWHDRYHWDLQCDYLRTFKDGWVFVGNSLFKVARDSIAFDVYPWPYDPLMRTFWSAMYFPGDEWPDQPRDIAKCLTLNVGIYVATIPLFIIAVYAAMQLVPPIILAHVAILETLGKSPTITLARTRTPYYKDTPHVPIDKDV
jgi:hypothetical protein